MRRRLFILLPLSLVGFAFLAAWLLIQARTRYAEKLSAQVWPREAQSIRLPLTTSGDGTNILLLLGDSRVAEWGTPSLPGWQVLNAGGFGMTTAQISQGSQGMMERIRPNIVVIQVGINDLKLLGPRPELREAVIDTCVSNILAVVRECRAMGAQVILTTVWPTGEVSTARRFVWSSAVEAGIHETNARLEKRLAAIPHVTVTNLLAAASVDLPPGKNYTLYRDTLHLRPAAYARLSKVLVETISSRSGNRSETK